MSASDEDASDRLGDVDALLWAVEQDPRLASTIASVSLFSPAIDPEQLRVRLERTTRVVPRLRQRVVGNPVSLVPPRWELDPDFDLDRHLDIVDCDGDGSLRDVLDQAAPLLAAPFDRERPLFHFTLIQGVEGDRSALVMKAHHAIADGLGMLQIQVELFDFEPDTPDPSDMPEAPTGRPLEPAERLTNAVEFERRRSADALEQLLRAGADLVSAGPTSSFDRIVDTIGSGLRNIAPVSPLSPVLTERSTDLWVDAVSLSLVELKARGRAVGTRMNPVFVAGVAKGLGLFHERVGEPVERLRMGMPVSSRTDADPGNAGNFIVPLRFELPLNADTPDQMIEITASLIDAQRDEPMLDFLGPATSLMTRLPAPVAGAVFARTLNGTDFLTSNVPGSPIPIHLGRSTMQAQYPFGPTNAAAVNVTLLSYQDSADLGISVDGSATDAPQALGDALRDGFEWILG